jgi:hypothetical protein
VGEVKIMRNELDSILLEINHYDIRYVCLKMPYFRHSVNSSVYDYDEYLIISKLMNILIFYLLNILQRMNINNI